MSKTLFITSALPYANGDIHLGHLFEHIQTDIWVRYQRTLGNVCHYICADDAHGTAVMIRAAKEGVSIDKWIDHMRQQHEQDMRSFGVNYDMYYTTHSPENRALSERIYRALVAKGLIERKTISQMYDAQEKMFLPDRYIKGECPHCHAADQYGDNCEECGSTYEPTQLIQPYSVLSNATPELRQSEHLFFNLPKLQAFLRTWIDSNHVQQQIRNKLNIWFANGLKMWDISRDAPYFGFEIPGETGKYFYVWLDAPIGYLAGLAHYCEKNNLDFDAFIRADSDIEMHHFIGKDIAYFHCLFWPALLHGADIRTPTGVYCHGFITVNGEKMSKSKGTFILASTFSQHANPEYLRYYYASRLNNSIDDIDFSLENFVTKINSDVIGKLINIPSRTMRILEKQYDNQLSDAAEHPIIHHIRQKKLAILACYDTRQYFQVINHLTIIADDINRIINTEQPWAAVKHENTRAHAQHICTTALHCYALLITLLSPVMPELYAQSASILPIPAQPTFAWLAQPFTGKVATFVPLGRRVEIEQFTAMIQQPTP